MMCCVKISVRSGVWLKLGWNINANAHSPWLTKRCCRTNFPLRYKFVAERGVRYHMLNRYPEQTRSRRGFALVGAIFLVFGLSMALVESGIGAFIGALFGFALLLPSVLFGESSFRKFEKTLSKIALFGSLS